MADMQGSYWDLNECAWVRCPTPVDAVTVEAVMVPEQPTGVESDQEADVRSG